MIRIFGKLRYHWQPELTTAIIYWSLAWMPLFFALSLIFENTSRPLMVFALAGLSLLLIILGGHRYFTIDEDAYLTIMSLNILSPRRLPIETITKVEVTKSSLALVLQSGERQLFYMRKWPKKYFLDALALQKGFEGEVELLDNFIELDYFETYRYDRRSKAR